VFFHESFEQEMLNLFKQEIELKANRLLPDFRVVAVTPGRSTIIKKQIDIDEVSGEPEKYF